MLSPLVHTTQLNRAFLSFYSRRWLCVCFIIAFPNGFNHENFSPLIEPNYSWKLSNSIQHFLHAFLKARHSVLSVASQPCSFLACPKDEVHVCLIYYFPRLIWLWLKNKEKNSLNQLFSKSLKKIHTIAAKTWKPRNGIE